MSSDPRRPNVVYILADDLGFGDIAVNNPASKIPTPNLDRLATRGMRFTDAHAGSSVCTPSRYHVLTGRYPWRSRLKRGIVWAWDGSLVEPGRPTVASYLREQGYRTSCVGKWHLGWDWATVDGRHPNESLEFGRMSGDRAAFGDQVDFTAQIRGGPVDHGFDDYIGVDVPNFPPYAWFVDDRLKEQPTEAKPEEMFGAPGPAVPGWSLEEVVPELCQQAVRRIETAAGEPEPLFLYLALTSPHTPVVPNERFRGMSGIGDYGDFVCELDWVVGEVMDALDRTGLTDNTMLIFASDNGPEGRTPQDEGAYTRVFTKDHYSMGPLRGIKRDAWEGGHRVPLLVCWPQLVPAGSRCDQPVSLGDLFATCADVLRAPPGEDAAEDSVSMLPLLRGLVDQPTRQCLVHHSMSGTFAIRQGNYVLIEGPTGDDNGEPEAFRELRGYGADDLAGQLFDLSADLAETRNLYAELPHKAAELSALLRAVQREPATQRVSRVG